MSDQTKPDTACEELSCKDDLFGGLLALFAQAEAQEQERKASEQDEVDIV